MAAISSIIMGVAAAAGAAMQYRSAKKAEESQEEAQEQAQANANRQADIADKQAKKAEQQINAANQKRPDTAAILAAAQQAGRAGEQAGRAGASGTMLTGPQGVDPNALALGKNTLLGQ